MTPDQYKAAEQAISDYRWLLAGALSSVSVTLTKENKQHMSALAALRDALEAEGMKG